MDVTTKAIAVRSTDYKENDKMILLYSLEYGKISVHARGIRKNTAKLKFAADQFCFGQYELAENRGRYTLKTCRQIESFFTLREDITAFYGGSAVMECLMNLTEEGQPDAEIFLLTLKTLEAMTCGTNVLTAVLHFLLNFLDYSGYKLDLSLCSACGEKSGRMYLDLYRGGAVCENCRTAESSAIPRRAAAVCSMVYGMPADKLKNLDLTNDMLKESLALCSRYISHSFIPLKSLAELIKIA